ncbi:hypothetical protein C8T65DRAFT_710796 [Cerioporus squamosus]|nr:hypothetical protein C8T65DRAFT_710796 [Cerioporus squamosus]
MARAADSFIRALGRARLNNSGLSESALANLRNPRHELPELSRVQIAGLRMLLARGDASEDNYADHRANMMWLHPEDEIPTLDQSKTTVAQVTGIDAIRTHMCTRRTCPECGEDRYDPDLQAMWGSPENARLMRHRTTETQRILNVLRTDGPAGLSIIDDIYHANDYLKLVQPGPDDNDMLYKNKASDCWFYVWILFDLPPTSRYKKAYILPGGPKNIESFLFPGLTHGLRIWDADHQPDSPAMAYLNGLVGHHGACGCRVYCGQLGRHKPGKGTYYPAMLRYYGEQSDNADINLRQRVENRAAEFARYAENLAVVEAAANQDHYVRMRLRTGIAKASIFSALLRVQLCPRGFGLDLMHLISLNIPDIIISLLRGSIECEAPDTKATWVWAVYMKRDIWEAHGKFIGSTTHCLPSSFERPPRNPALKIKSGFKAWEFLIYVYGYLPALLRTVLPPLYYQHFCKLVYAIRLLIQRSLPRAQLSAAHQCIVTYLEEFETHYYQRRVERLHFVRPCLHTLSHIVGETLNTGLCSLYTQWTMENYIGSITSEIRQHVTPYANVSERALRRCQANALQAMLPALFAPEERLPRRAIDVGDGYILLSPFEEVAHPVGALEVAAFHEYFARTGINVPADLHPSVRRWARLRLPTGQNARTLWKEGKREEALKQPRRARMVKLRGNHFAEVQFYFQMTVHGLTQTLALVSLFSPPDAAILDYSVYTLLVCQYRARFADSYRVVSVKDIVSVVAMLPHPLTPEEETHAHDYVHHFFVMEKPGLDVAVLGGVAQALVEDEDD